jgi:hypothetical protein
MFLEEIKTYCNSESQRSDEQAESLYSRRMETAISKSVRRPFCIPYSEVPRKTINEWVDSNDIRLVSDFSFYHHSKEDVIRYSVEKRGDYDTLYTSMKNLYLDEFPAPTQSGKAYMVSSNGQHRRLVYNCIGLPKVNAYVQKCSGNRWRYYFRNNQNAYRVIKWLMYKGFLEEIELLDDRTMVISDKNNIIGWILPDSEISTLRGLLNDMEDRFNLLCNSFDDVDKSILKYIHGSLRLCISIYFVYKFK